jgi:hypothetical protein
MTVLDLEIHPTKREPQPSGFRRCDQIWSHRGVQAALSQRFGVHLASK